MKVLIVDDSVVFRMSISEGLKGIPGVDIVGTASNGQIAIDLLKKDPSIDLMILDMEMPVKDGITTIEEVRTFNQKVIIIVFSSLTLNGADLTLRALELGANDFVTKQEASSAVSLDESLEMIKGTLLPKIKAFDSVLQKSRVSQKVEEVKPTPSPTPVTPAATVSPSSTPTTSGEKLESGPIKFDLNKLLDEIPVLPKLICIASSTGGPDALTKLVKGITVAPPVPILLVQHMPPIFTQKLAEMLDGFTSCMKIKEAEAGETIQNGVMYIAPGDYHMTLNRDLTLAMNQNEKVSFVRPSATVMYQSVFENFTGKTLSIIMTGMGDDGAAGIKGLLGRGDYALIQDENSSVVWGMPGSVHQAYPKVKELPLEEIPLLLNEVFKRLA